MICGERKRIVILSMRKSRISLESTYNYVMAGIDALRAYLVGNSLQHTIIVSLFALPLALIGGLMLTLPLRLGSQRRIQWAIGVLILCLTTLLNLKLLPWLATQLALPLSQPNLALIIGTVPALAWVVSPSVSFAILLAVDSNVSRFKIKGAKMAVRWHLLLRVVAATLMLLLCNSSAVLLLNGGRPFNATHTLASWVFTQAWVNGDVLNSFWQATVLFFLTGLLSGSVALFDRLVLFDRLALWQMGLRFLLAGVAPYLLVIVPALFRQANWADGRSVLIVTDFLIVATILGWLTLQRHGLRTAPHSENR